MTPAEAALRSRRAQGLPDHVIDDQALDAIAALIAATPVEAGDRREPTDKGRRRPGWEPEAASESFAGGGGHQHVTGPVVIDPAVACHAERRCVA